MGYPYTADLLALEAQSATRLLMPELEVVTTPLIKSKWAAMLQQHPDQAFAQYVVLFDRLSPICVQLWSTLVYLAEEVEPGRIVGPIHNQVGVHVNRFGVIPKNVPGKWRHPRATVLMTALLRSSAPYRIFRWMI